MPRSHNRSYESEYLELVHTSECFNSSPDNPNVQSKLKSTVLEKCTLNIQDYFQARSNLVMQTTQSRMASFVSFSIHQELGSKIWFWPCIGINQALEIDNMDQTWNCLIQNIEFWNYRDFPLGTSPIWKPLPPFWLPGQTYIQTHCSGRLVPEQKELSGGILCLRCSGGNTNKISLP